MAVRQNERGSYDSDQGLQYSSKDWQKFRQKYNLVPSMSRHLVQYTAR
nr:MULTISPECIES: transposase family protein [Acinetobacter Taxon 24]